MLASEILSPEIAVIEIGTSCKLSARFCAVTITSSSWAAYAPPEAVAMARAIALIVRIDFFMVFPLNIFIGNGFSPSFL